MKTDINGCSTCAAGHESFEEFRRRGQKFFQYDYRTAAGKLFSCIQPTLALCRQRRNDWLDVNA